MAKRLEPPRIACRGLCAWGDSLIRAPEVSSLLSLIMNFSSGLVWAGPLLRLGNGLGGVLWRPSPRCIRNHCGQELQKKPESPPTGSQPYVISPFLDERALVFVSLGVSRALRGVN